MGKATCTLKAPHSLLDCIQFTSPQEREAILHEAHVPGTSDDAVSCNLCQNEAEAQAQVQL